MATANIAAFANLFNKDISELNELSSFQPPPTGVYNMTTSVSFKLINDAPAVEANFRITDVVEAEEPVGKMKPAKSGDEFSIAFILIKKDKTPNDVAEGKMREFLEYFTGYAGTTNVEELVTGKIKDVAITATVKTKQDKDDEDRFRVDVKDITIA